MNRSIWSCGLFCLLALACLSVLGQESAEDNELRLTRLESLAGRIKMGGWLDFIYADSDEESQRDYFDVQHVYLNFDITVSEHWLAFVEIEYENLPETGNDDDSGGSIILDRGYIEYRYHAGARLRMGKFNTPAGIWKPNHWAVTTDTTLEPIMEIQEYIPDKSVGLQFLGTKENAKGKLEYTLIVSNGAESSNTRERSDAGGVGGDLKFHFLERGMLGVSFHHLDDDRPESGATERGFMVYGQVDIVPRRLLFRGEYLHYETSSDLRVDTYYVKLKWSFHERLYANFRFDSADTRDGDDPRVEQGTEVLTFGYWPHPRVRLKAELAQTQFEYTDRDEVRQWSAWIGLIF